MRRVSLANMCMTARVAALLLAAPEGVEAVGAMLAPDGRHFTVTAPGLTGIQGRFAATLRVDDEARVLSSTNGFVVLPEERRSEPTPYGPAEVSAVTIRFEKEEVDLLFRLGRVPGLPGVLAQAGIRNTGTNRVTLVSATPASLHFAVTGKPSEWLLTTLDESVAPTTASVELSQISQPVSIREYGGLYRRDGIGFLFGPVGTPIAYVHAEIAHAGEGNVTLDFLAEMSDVQVDPGGTRWGQQVVFLMEPPRAALPRWSEWVAKTHGARTSKGALSGWGSWYFMGKKVTGKDVLDVAETAAESEGRLRPDVIQIDAGYQDPGGRKQSSAGFPDGMASYARRIAATGTRPGLFVEVNPLIQTKEGVDRVQPVRDAVAKGYSYLKLVRPQPVEIKGQKQTAFELQREFCAAIREAAGEDTYLLFWGYYPDRGVLGAADAQRTGRDAGRNRVRVAITDALRTFHLQDRWFAVDNDAYYMGTDVQNVSKITGGWPLVRTWLSMVGLSCGAANTSDPWHWESFKPYWRNVEVLTPPARERTEVLDLCTAEECSRLVGHVVRDWGDWSVALLWNPGEKEQRITLDFAMSGLNPEHRYAVWSFWDNRYLGVAKGSWTTTTLGPSASQHLRFTDLSHTPHRPVLIGSNLHIYCGAAEIRRVGSSRGAMEIELSDAGARDGDLFVYSRLPLLLKEAAGCMVTDVASAGEYVWRIGLADRRRGEPQRIVLSVLLPVTQQAWFWLLIALVAASLLFAALRYVDSLRLQRENALAQERSRIAQDLHDNLGADLTQMALLGELTLRNLDRPESARLHLEKLFASAHAATRQLDAVVWAVNPAYDTLESVVQHLCKFAQEFLTLAGIRCRLAVPGELPPIALSSPVRHDLFLAVKETLHNVVQHADATLVTLRILIREQELVVEIEDNGKGFPDGKHLPEQDGLDNIQARMAKIGGRSEYESGPDGRGTRVRMRMPIGRKV